ncbi:hypothetical protein CVT26_010464 [Gymnopilus dilepis]|uniref:Uncharacterized protein n=1 Tax=Gymnopilus dilepis TaxID=231916 RepID=A0A409Y0D2_9AGAR|nr:hypothetical protein CVT26_010464 [Gymnopilus dilepis]
MARKFAMYEQDSSVALTGVSHNPGGISQAGAALCVPDISFQRNSLLLSARKLVAKFSNAVSGVDAKVMFVASTPT